MKSLSPIKDSTNSANFSYFVKEQEQKDDQMINELIFKKYQIKKKFAKTSTIDIYDGISIENNQPVTIKIEKKTKEKLYLEEEAYNLYSFKGFGIPELIKIGKRENNIVLIETKKGPSLYELFWQNNKKFTLNEICLIGIQCIERLKWIHSKYYIHRNIKPENFVIGLDDPHVIYLQNFYLCQRYRSSKSFQHIKLIYINQFVGTERYGSINALRGFTQGRKDDLESLFYMLIYFFLGKLPWQGLKEENEVSKHEKILKEKRNFKIDKYKQIPQEFCSLFKYVKNLKFDEEPKYLSMIKKLQNILKENQCFNNNDFYWIKNNDKCHGSNIKIKKEGIRGRLLDKIQNQSKTENLNIFSGRKVKNDDVNLDNIGFGYIDDDDNENEEKEDSVKEREKTDYQVRIKRLAFDESENENQEKNEEDDKSIENDLNESNSSINTKIYKLNGPKESLAKKDLSDNPNIANNNEINNKNSNNLSQKESKNKTLIFSHKSKNICNEIIAEEPFNEDESEKNSPEIRNCNQNNILEENNPIYDDILKGKSIASSNSNKIKQESTKESIQYNNIKESDIKGNNEPVSLILIKNNSQEDKKEKQKIITNNNKENDDKNKKKIVKDSNNKIIITKKKENKFGQIMGPVPIDKMKRAKSLGNKGKKEKNKDCIIF